MYIYIDTYICEHIYKHTHIYIHTHIRTETWAIWAQNTTLQQCQTAAHQTSPQTAARFFDSVHTCVFSLVWGSFAGEIGLFCRRDRGLVREKSNPLDFTRDISLRGDMFHREDLLSHISQLSSCHAL